MSALQLHSPQAALTSVLSSLDICSLVCAQMADGNDMVQALASYPTVQAAARQIGASTAAQAAAEAACEAGRGPVVPVVRQERLKSFDSARRTAGVLPCGRVLNELLPTSAVALYAAGVLWPPHPSWLGLPARASSPYPGV